MRDDRTTKALLVLGSAACLTLFSPASAGMFAISLLAGWSLGRRGRVGRVGVILVHVGLMIAARTAGSTLGLLGLGALGLQQLAWVAAEDAEELSLVDYLFATLFLPRALAGPVWSNLRRVRATPDPSGWTWVLMGLVEKVVIADSFAWRADLVFDGHGPVPMLLAWSGVIAFAAQALFDLAGLWHIAAGLALVVGFPLPAGPLRPFRARTLGEFWTRWHPSLAAVLHNVASTLGGLGSASLIAATVAVLWHAIHPMVALAALTQVLWMGLGRLLPFHPGRWLVLLGALHGLLLARSPSLERAAFVQDGIYGVFGVGSPDPVTLLTLAGGVMVLALGPLDPPGVFQSQRHGTSSLALGAGLAALVLWFSQARPFLYPTF